MRHLEFLEPRRFLSVAPAGPVAISPLTSYFLDKHGVLMIKAAGNLYAKVASVKAPHNVEVQIADDSGGTADLTGVSRVTILGTEKTGQQIDWQANGVDATIFAQGSSAAIFVDDLGNDTTSIVLGGTGGSVNLDGQGNVAALALGNPKTNQDTLNVSGNFKVVEWGFQNVFNNGTGTVNTPLHGRCDASTGWR